MKFLKSFSKHDRDAIILLVLVIIVAVALFPLLADEDDVPSAVNPHPSSVSPTPSLDREGRGGSFHPFDPNTASEEELLSLGLSPRLVGYIYKYRARGGRYRTKTDFARLYGLTLKQYRQLEPYITITPEVMARDVIKPNHPSSVIPHPTSVNHQPSSVNTTPSLGREGRGGSTPSLGREFCKSEGRGGSSLTMSSEGRIDKVKGRGGSSPSLGREFCKSEGRGEFSLTMSSEGRIDKVKGRGGSTPSLGREGRGGSSLSTQHSALRPSNKLAWGETIDVNGADTALLKRVPGIGSYFARRIVELRQRRGGMLESPEELLAIRNFPETALVYMTAGRNFEPIYVNRWSQKELAQHPLLNYAQAREIIMRRKTAGPITNIDDLSALPSFSPQTIKKIKDFISFK